jgi:hypothetical protein
MEAVIARLVEAGMPGPIAVHAYGILITYTLGFASYQRPRPWGRTDLPESQELLRQQRHLYAGLPAQEFPHMVELAEPLTTLPATEEFYRCLDYLFDGLIRAVEKP